MTLPHIAVDFESYYDTNISLKKMGTQEYLSLTEVYLVSVYDGNGLNFVGPPEKFDWSILHDRVVVSHNANFDSQVFTHLQKLKIIPENIQPKEWGCTANLAAYLGSPRSLDGACQHLFKAAVNKDVRKRLRGKRWAQLPGAMQQEVIQYARGDSQYCHRIWAEHSHKWPEKERAFSLLTLVMCASGVMIDAETLEESRQILWSQKEIARQQIPWTPTLSYAAFTKACEAEGITPPKSLAITDEECDAWMEMYRGKYPWVEAMRNYRRCNTLNRKIDKMLSRQRGDGRMPFELKYWGSHTGRDSGSGGINMQNLPHGELYGVDLRSAIIAPEGHKLIIADLEQIEARILLTLVKDEGQLAIIRTGVSPYVAHARATMGATGPIDKGSGLYRLAKARVLALGYGAGWRKFNVMAYLPIYLGRAAAEVFASPVSQVDIAAFSEYFWAYEKDKLVQTKWRNRTPELETEWTNSWLIVKEYRRSNHRIPLFWRFFDEKIHGSVGDDWSFLLPSGRLLSYSKIKENHKDGLTCEIVRGDKLIRTKIYGGKITENVVQALARDVFMEACLRVAQAGYRIIMRVHDELVVEVPARNAEEDRLRIKDLMGVSPAWLANCPVTAESKITERYLK